MNKLSFKEIFTQKIKNEKNEEIELSKIIIPMIQRDYAQGREDPTTTRVRDRFLQSLYDAITKEPTTLDFIYGDIDQNNIMTPLDGQQRLTTLFLLYWYSAKKENIEYEEYVFLNKFSYATRPSVREFCKQLVGFCPKFDKEKLSEEIINQNWFPLDWKKDPTIHSMLVMLDSISEKFSNINNIWEKLEENVITFYFLPIKDIGVTDEIYIKMNSRGKPLTNFENFKAELEQELDYAKENNIITQEVNSRIKDKIDKSWTDLLWEYKDDSNIIDDYFLNYFRFICDIICYKMEEVPKKIDEIDLIKEYFLASNENFYDNIEILEKYFDCWVDISNQTNIDEFFESYISNTHEKGKIKIDKKDINVFRDCIVNYNKNFTFGRSLILYSFIVYILNKNSINEEQFRRRIRIVNNLIENSEDEMSSSTGRSGGNRISPMVNQIDNIILTGKIDNEMDKNNFNKTQLLEEEEKIKWCEENPEKCEKLYELEDHDYLYGQISILGLENYDLFDRFHKLFNCDLDKVDCALLTIGNYAQALSSGRYQLGSNKRESWVNLFHKSEAKKNFEQTKNTLCNLLQITDEINNDFLDLIINEYINKCELNSRYDWRYYYIKYNEFRPKKYGKYYWRDFENKPYEFLVMVTNRILSENAYQPFLKVIDKNNGISKQDNGNKLIDTDYIVEIVNNAYIVYNREDESECRKIIIEQDEKGIDKEDRILKIKHILDS